MTSQATSPTAPHPDVPDYAPEPQPRPPARPGLLAAAGRYWYVVLVAVILCAAAAGAWAVRRPATHTAEARVSAMNLQVQNIAALPGVLDASRALTTLYSRAAVADAVTGPVARKLGVTRAYVADHVTATPLPDAPIIKVSATGTSAAQAVAMANGTARSLLAYVKAQTGSQLSDRGLLARFRREQRKRAKLLQAQDDAQKNLRDLDTSDNRAKLAGASADLADADLRLEALRAQYLSGQETRQAAPVAKLMSTASTAKSNRTSQVQIAVFIGLIVGLAVGLALAGLLSARRERRLGRS
ncbi:MAG TPA: hypothetical protein VH418_07105 [Solirubrobacteraceae bacterium]